MIFTSCKCQRGNKLKQVLTYHNGDFLVLQSGKLKINVCFQELDRCNSPDPPSPPPLLFLLPSSCLSHIFSCLPLPLLSASPSLYMVINLSRLLQHEPATHTQIVFSSRKVVQLRNRVHPGCECLQTEPQILTPACGSNSSNIFTLPSTVVKGCCQIEILIQDLFREVLLIKLGIQSLSNGIFLTKLLHRFS